MNFILKLLVMFLMGCEGQDNIDTFVIQSTKAIILPQRERGKALGLFSYPQHHPLSNRDKDYSYIHPHDTVHLFLKMENGSSYFTILKPNMDLISPDIHKEVANNRLSSSHPHTILSTMKVYQGHMEQEVMDSYGSIILDSASLVIQDDGKYVPTQTSSSSGISSTQHHFLNPKIKGSIDINGEVFEISSPLEDRGPLIKKRASSASTTPGECGVVPKREGQFFPKSSLIKRTVNPCPSKAKVANLAVAADCHYVKTHGGIKGTTEHLTTLYNEVSKVYQQHFNVKIRIAKAYFEEKCGGNSWNVESCGGYVMVNMLNAFTSWVQSKKNSGMAYSTLFTGCKSTDSTSGYSFVDALCTPDAVGVTSNIANEVNTAMHEMGHAFGSDHDCNGSEASCCACKDAECSKSYVMNPVASSSKEFSKCTIEKVCNSIATKGRCLTDSDGNDNHNMKNLDSSGTTDPQDSGDNSGEKTSGNGIHPPSGGSTCAAGQPVTSVPENANQPASSLPDSCTNAGNNFEKTNPELGGSSEKGATVSDSPSQNNHQSLGKEVRIGEAVPNSSTGTGKGTLSITQGKKQNEGNNNLHNLNSFRPGEQSKTTEAKHLAVNNLGGNGKQDTISLKPMSPNISKLKAPENIGSSNLKNQKPSVPGQSVRNLDDTAHKLRTPTLSSSTIVPANLVPDKKITTIGSSSNAMANNANAASSGVNTRTKSGRK